MAKVEIPRPYRFTRLENGLRIVSEQLPHVRSVSAGIWLGVGSRHERSPHIGASHFIEHMLFKGTESRSARQLAEEIDAVGGQMNAFTGKEYTCYYARVLDEHLELALDVLSDMVCNSTFSPENIERERGVILEELRMYQDSPDELVHDVFAQAIWPRHELGRPVVGDPDSVAQLDRDKLLAYFGDTYRPNNMIVSVAGNVDHDRLVGMVASRLGDLGGRGEPYALPAPTPGFDLSIVSKPGEQVHVCVGGSGVPFADPDFHVLSVLSTILGGGSSSRLFQRIREDRGLAYSVFSYETSYSDTGMFAIYAGTSPANAREALDLILEELETTHHGQFGEDEVARAREQLRGGMMIGLESMNARMNRMARWLLFQGEIQTVEQVLAEIDRVTFPRAADLAARILDRSRFACALVGPVPDEVNSAWNR